MPFFTILHEIIFALGIPISYHMPTGIYMQRWNGEGGRCWSPSFSTSHKSSELVISKTFCWDLNIGLIYNLNMPQNEESNILQFDNFLGSDDPFPHTPFLHECQLQLPQATPLPFWNPVFTSDHHTILWTISFIKSLNNRFCSLYKYF